MCLSSTFLYPGFNPFSWWFLFLIFHQSSKYSSNVAGLLCPVSLGVLYVFAFLQLLLIFSGRQKTQVKERQTVGGRKTGRFLCRIFKLKAISVCTHPNFELHARMHAECAWKNVPARVAQQAELMQILATSPRLLHHTETFHCMLSSSVTYPHT